MNPERWWFQGISAVGPEGAQCSVGCEKGFGVGGCFSGFGFTGSICVLDLMQQLQKPEEERSSGMVWENLGRLKRSLSALFWISADVTWPLEAELPGLSYSSLVSR